LLKTLNARKKGHFAEKESFQLLLFRSFRFSLAYVEKKTRCDSDNRWAPGGKKSLPQEEGTERVEGVPEDRRSPSVLKIEYPGFKKRKEERASP